MPSAAVNGINISYQVHRPASQSSDVHEQYVVLINGLADPKETWAYQIEPLTTAGYTVVVFDNRGIGETSCPPGPYTADLLADDAKGLTSQLHLAKFHLMGVSMGGMIAQAYALKFPDDLLSLTLACTYAAPGPFCSRMFDMWADTAPVMGVPHVMRDVLLWAFTTDFFSDPERAAELKEVEDGMRFMTQSTPAYLAQLNVIRAFDVTAQIPSIKTPTLVLAGEGDILIPVGLSRKIHELIPGSKWVTVRGGHGCMWEFPRNFNEAFLDFLGSIKA